MVAQSDFDKAQKLYDDKKYGQAISLFEKVLAENPSNDKAAEIVGDYYGQAKNWDKAIIYYRKLKTISPKNATYWYKYGGVLGMKAKNSNRFVALGLISDIKFAFEKSLKLDPKHIDAHWASIELYLQLPGILGGSEEKATNFSDNLMLISPVDGHLSKARIAEYQKNLKSAEKHYIAAHQIGNSKTTYQSLYDFYINKLKDTSKAEKLKSQYK
jgi:tetratricopeptide (TPR) repeat protein